MIHTQLPVLFNYERSFSRQYKGIYSEILDDSYSPSIDDNGELEWENENESFNSSNIKDVYGVPKLFKSITRGEVLDLLEELKRQPYTILSNKKSVAKKVFDELKSSLSHQITVIPAESQFLHGRKHSSDKIGFTDDEMLTAPPYCVRTERFNPAEVPAYYLGDSIETIQKELRLDDEEKGKNDLQYVQITTKRPLHVLDIRNDECLVFEYCKYPLVNPSPRPTEYLVPNFIAQCCSQLKENGDVQIDGILYQSTVNPAGHCLVLFEANSSLFKITKRSIVPFV